MTYAQAVVLGIVQGLTEFLPVSSSGHLAVVAHLLGIAPDLGSSILLHAGTLVAVIVFYAGDLWAMLQSLFGAGQEPKKWRRLFWLLVIASVPTAIIGVLLASRVEKAFGSLRAVGVSFILTGVVLWLAGHRPPGRIGANRARPGQAILVGIGQGVAVFPGVSRSGLTVATGLLLGFEREFAARFAFLLSVPAIGGAFALDMLHGLGTSGAMAWHRPDWLGFAVAAVAGYVSIRFLLRLIEKGKLAVFSYYCWLAGLLTLWLAR